MTVFNLVDEVHYPCTPVPQAPQPAPLSGSWKNILQPVEGMGNPEVCFGDSEVYLCHVTSGRVVGCPVGDRKRRPGSVNSAVVSNECNKMFSFSVTRASEEEGRAAAIIEGSHDIMRKYVHK